MIWTELVDLIYGGLVCVSTALGGSMGWAIAVVSLAVRLGLLPLTLRIAYRGLEMQARLRRLAPELARIRARHA
jgi:membrane protein insertase Oxa1/YidC/SpoIIIJ